MIAPHLMPTLSPPTVPLPDIHGLEPRKQILWVLVASKQEDGSGLLAAAEISAMLAEPHGIAISRQRVVAMLEKERAAGTVRIIRRDGLTYFQVMRLGEDEVLGASVQSIFIDPDKALSSIRSVEDILRSLAGEVRICDTYIDSRTLDYVAEIINARKVHLLTENVQDSSRLKRDLVAFSKEHAMPLEVRVAAAGQLHDRYVLHPKGMLFIGASLKDIGKKQSMVVALPSSFARELERGFARVWAGATKFG